MIHFITDDDKNSVKPAHDCGFTRFYKGSTAVRPSPSWYCGLCGLVNDEDQESLDAWVRGVKNKGADGGEDFGK